MFVKLIFEDFEHFENRKRVTLTRPAIAGQFEDFEHFENRKRVTLTRPAIAGQLKTAIMKADGFTCTAPSHERSRSAETY